MPQNPGFKSRVQLLAAVAVVAGLTVVAVAGLLINIFTRKQEARNPFVRVVELTEDTVDPELWGKNFPFQYDAYKRTTQMLKTRFGGSEAMPRIPTDDDPRAFVSRSKLDADPRLKTFWAGYAFSKDFRERRGHAYMLEDQMYTKRQKAAKQPGTCVHCHASVIASYRKLGNGDPMKGFELMNAMPYADARKLVAYPIACIDCHDPKTMALRVTRPAFLEGIKALQAGRGIKNYDPNTMATRQEMRSFVCGQCHVEYYFKGKEKRLVYPWAKGLKVENIAAYYDEAKQTDWVHAESGVNMLKMQHPEFELWNQGIHARAGVACADCHMPYMRVGAMKVSDHHVRSPLLNINRACQTCHKASESELKARVEEIQDRTYKLRNEALDAVVSLITDLAQARKAGREDPGARLARDLHRKAQLRLDFVEAENSAGFHAPQESARILGEALDLARQAQIVLRDPKFKPTQPLTGP